VSAMAGSGSFRKSSFCRRSSGASSMQCGGIRESMPRLCAAWSGRPNGGPEDRKVLNFHIHQLNRMLQLHGLRVRGSTSGGYRIVSTEEIVP
jgi:hypothetical protein